MTGLLLCSAAQCQFGIDTVLMIARLESQLTELRSILQNAQQYKQLFDNASAFVHNPAQFLAAVAQIEQVAVNVAASSGVTTQQKIDQLQKIIQMQQVTMREAQQIGSISNGNAANIGQLANAMSAASTELSDLNAQLKHEQRVAYYQQRATYQPQAAVISQWRLR
jgi:hypothetical protein